MTEHEETEEASSRFYVLVMIYTQFRYIKGANVGAVTLTGAEHAVTGRGLARHHFALRADCEER